MFDTIAKDVNKKLRKNGNSLTVIYRDVIGSLRRDDDVYYLWHSKYDEEEDYSIGELCTLIHNGVVVLL